MSSGDGLDSELESFRKQWLSDLQSQKGPHSGAAAAGASSANSHRRRQSHSRRQDAPQLASGSSRPGPLSKRTNGPPSPTAARRALILDEGSDYLAGRSFDELEPPAPSNPGVRTLGTSNDVPSKPAEKKTALDYYEEGMEKEAEGNMGESLQLYRRAYRVRPSATPITLLLLTILDGPRRRAQIS